MTVRRQPYIVRHLPYIMLATASISCLRQQTYRAKGISRPEGTFRHAFRDSSPKAQNDKQGSVPLPSGVILRAKPEGSRSGEALLRSEILRQRLRMTSKEASFSPFRCHPEERSDEGSQNEKGRQDNPPVFCFAKSTLPVLNFAEEKSLPLVGKPCLCAKKEAPLWMVRA